MLALVTPNCTKPALETVTCIFAGKLCCRVCRRKWGFPSH